MKKLKFYIKGTSFIWLPIVGGYIANMLSNLLISML